MQRHFATNNLTIARNSSNIQGAAVNSILNTNRASVVLVYVDSTEGWLYTVENNVGDLGPPYMLVLQEELLQPLVILKYILLQALEHLQ